MISPQEVLTRLAHKPGAFLGFVDAYTATSRLLGIPQHTMCQRYSQFPFSRMEYKSSMFIKKGSELKEYFNYG